MQRFSREEHDIAAEITFVPTIAGGRTRPMLAGYRPQFSYNNHDWDAVHAYPGRVQVFPGETVTVFLTFLSPERHVGRVYPGMPFAVKEGHRVVGLGRVTGLLNLAAAAAAVDAAAPLQCWTSYWSDDRGDAFATWGGARYYFVCRASGSVVEQLEIYDDGSVLWYDETHPEDTYGGLSLAPIDTVDAEFNELSLEAFANIRARVVPRNR